MNFWCLFKLHKHMTVYDQGTLLAIVKRLSGKKWSYIHLSNIAALMEVFSLLNMSISPLKLVSTPLVLMHMPMCMNSSFFNSPVAKNISSTDSDPVWWWDLVWKTFWPAISCVSFCTFIEIKASFIYVPNLIIFGTKEPN